MPPRKVPRSPLPKAKPAWNVACPKHGTTFLAGPNKQQQIVCLSCGWSTPFDHKAVLAPRATPTEER